MGFKPIKTTLLGIHPLEKMFQINTTVLQNFNLKFPINFLETLPYFDRLVSVLKKGEKMKKFVAELIGTLTFVFIGTGAVVLEMVLMALVTLESPCLWFSHRGCSLLNRNCFRCSLEPSGFDRYVC